MTICEQAHGSKPVILGPRFGDDVGTIEIKRRKVGGESYPPGNLMQPLSCIQDILSVQY